MSFRPITQIVHAPEGSLSSLRRRADSLDDLTAALSNTVPPSIGHQVRVASYSPGRLVVQTHSQATATRLRFLAPAMVSALVQQSHLPAGSQLKVIVRPKDYPLSRTAPRQARPLPDTAAAVLLGLAASESGSVLGRALERLASRAGPARLP